ncbi:MAG TPA: hypothetical protein VGS03_19830 [Candidatus Polarisedimenticolia bacterium]|nr:hypothetical protein [Candidatus Polarisedimenticolia bacterium]
MCRVPWWARGGLALLVVFAVVSEAAATCGSANCFLVTGTQEGIPSQGRFVVDLSFRYVPQDRKLSGREHVDEVITPAIDFEAETIEPDHHREIQTLNELMQVDLSWGVAPRLSVVGALPILNRRYHEHFDDVGTPEESFSNDAGTTGLGDLRVGVRGALLIHPRRQLIGSLGVELPTGPYRLRDDEGVIGEPTLMPGSGSYDVALGVLYTQLVGERGWNLFASGTWKRNGRNPLDYQLGLEQVYAFGAERPVGAAFSWSVQANARMTSRDDYRGESVPSTGATLLNLSPGFKVKSEDRDLTFYLYAQVPVFQDVNEAQLAPRYGMLLGLSKIF